MTRSAPDPSNARELLALAELTGIHTYEIHGEIVNTESSGDHLSDPEIAVRLGERSIETRMRVQFTAERARLVADVSAEYTLSEPARISDEVLAEFVERIGVMSVYPFIRESLLTTASRMGIPAPVLGLLHAGAFRVGGLVRTDGWSQDQEMRTPVELAQELGVSAQTIRAWLRANGHTPRENGRWELSPQTTDAVRTRFS